MRAKARRRLLVTAVAAGLAAAMWGAVPAQAYQACTLRFYWNTDGSSSWQSEPVDSVGCVSTSAITRSSSATEVAVELPDGSLRFYWNNDGSPTWFSEQVAGPGSVASSPGITKTNGGTAIVAAGPDGSLWFYWNTDGSPTWHPVQVAGPGSVLGTPAITNFAGQTDVAITTPGGSVWFYWVTDGTPTWHSTQASGSVVIAGSPAIVSGFAFPFIVTIIQATGLDGSLWFRWASDGTTDWHPTWLGSASSSPAMIRSSNATEIVAAGQ
jgi:hypothetical protein